MSRPLQIEITDLAKTQIRAAEDWWRLNRPKAPDAIREELERASVLLSLQPDNRLNVYAGKLEVRPPGAPTTQAGFRGIKVQIVAKLHLLIGGPVPST